MRRPNYSGVAIQWWHFPLHGCSKYLAVNFRSDHYVHHVGSWLGYDTEYESSGMPAIRYTFKEPEGSSPGHSGRENGNLSKCHILK